MVTTGITVESRLVHENADLVEKGAVWTPLVHEMASLVEKGAVLHGVVHENASLVENSTGILR